jgi:hypothetical protein
MPVRSAICPANFNQRLMFHNISYANRPSPGLRI